MKRLFFVAAVAAAVLPSHAFALEVSGWVPYWSGNDGANDARDHLESLTSVRPFTYSVTSDGKVRELVSMKSGAWKRLVQSAKSEGVAVIPTVMWSSGEAIDKILSSSSLRAKHVSAVADLVRKGKYDGVDIDYEGKLAKTAPYFSSFLKELKSALGEKTLSCTIEARTPPDSLYTTPPKTITYANDYAALNAYCDTVTLMTYDQQRADLKLNAARKGAPYYPVADPEWVKKVVLLATKDIDADKLILGIPTYGREVALTVAPEWYKAYTQIRSVNPDVAEETADDHDVTPSRNAAGELSATYLPSTASVKLSALPAAPKNTPSGNVVAARALAYANKTGKTLTVNMLWWSDAEAIEAKTALAQSLGLSGVALFKIDGNEDQNLWGLF